MTKGLALAAQGNPTGVTAYAIRAPILLNRVPGLVAVAGRSRAGR